LFISSPGSVDDPPPPPFHRFPIKQPKFQSKKAVPVAMPATASTESPNNIGTPPIGKLARVTRMIIAAMIKNALPRAHVAWSAMKFAMISNKVGFEGPPLWGNSSNKITD